VTPISTWFPVLLAVAVALGLAGAALAEDDVGVVKEVCQDFLTVTFDGKDVTYLVSDKTKVTVAGKEAKLADLKKGMKVGVLYKRDGNKLVATEVAAATK
jgi:Cu/Ag efflux protein CusF